MRTSAKAERGLGGDGAQRPARAIGWYSRRQHCEQHLHVLELLERERSEDASKALCEHLQSTLDNLGSIKDILGSDTPARRPRK
ncbi:GntR family transcriptional regulator [Bordetella ansorpii]|jgi:hypothetical protein|uniref:GntR family transcriptional regulator n=1 Tax=Bordetella ansorpii TaxID=288768 RepID=A0A157PD95_9BORD|nr:GntR family transcriptional regulator [Bordetella ansorpii]